jgi:hypothetical protein
MNGSKSRSHKTIALGWINNKTVTFISTNDSINVVEVKRWVGTDRISIPATEVVFNYNKFMGGGDQHDSVRSTFSIGKVHKYKNYCIKRLMFVFDMALANAWIHHSMEDGQ